MVFDLHKPIADWLFPRRCLACGQDIFSKNICSSCRSLVSRCGGTLLASTAPPSLFFFELLIKDLIKGAKFNQKNLFTHLLIELMREEIERSGLIAKVKKYSPSVITPVPTHWINRLIRGIDLPILFATTLSSMSGIRTSSLLTRTSFRSRQALIKKRSERRAAIRGSFKLKNPTARYQRILLVDDIVTTGATFQESQKMLKTISEEVRCMSIAKTP